MAARAPYAGTPLAPPWIASAARAFATERRGWRLSPAVGHAQEALITPGGRRV